MSYNEFEISSESGRPVALYEFQYGNTVWRYTTSDADISLGTNEVGAPVVWSAHTITDSGVTQGGNDQNDLQISVQSDNPVAALYRNNQPSGKVWLRVRRYHVGDPDEETPLLWTGTVVNCVLTDPATIQMSCRSLGGTYDRNGLRLGWDRVCPHPIYGVGCFVQKEDHKYSRVIATVDGLSFTCTEHSEPEEGSFTGGFIEWVRADGSLSRRAVERQSGNHFVMLGATDGLTVGLAVDIYPGCVRSTENCKRFNNLPNFGGFPHLPGKSPFDGTPVF